MDDLERVSNLTSRLYDLLSQVEHVKALIQESHPQIISSNESSDTDNSHVDEPAPKPELNRTWSCCFIRKQKLK